MTVCVTVNQYCINSSPQRLVSRSVTYKIKKNIYFVFYSYVRIMKIICCLLGCIFVSQKCRSIFKTMFSGPRLEKFVHHCAIDVDQHNSAGTAYRGELCRNICLNLPKLPSSICCITTGTLQDLSAKTVWLCCKVTQLNTQILQGNVTRGLRWVGGFKWVFSLLFFSAAVIKLFISVYIYKIIVIIIVSPFMAASECVSYFHFVIVSCLFQVTFISNSLRPRLSFLILRLIWCLYTIFTVRGSDDSIVSGTSFFVSLSTKKNWDFQGYMAKVQVTAPDVRIFHHSEIGPKVC